jgi:hypothetical protein
MSPAPSKELGVPAPTAQAHSAPSYTPPNRSMLSKPITVPIEKAHRIVRSGLPMASRK